MSRISPYLQKILNERWARNVRQAIHDAISQCYNDVNAPALQTEAMEAAVQAKIDAGEMAALTIADGTITGAKLADGTIPTAKIADGAITMAKLSDDIDLDVETDTTLTQPGIPADAKAVGDAFAEAITGESLEDGELMKYIRVSKYDDFEIIDGYGYFDAQVLMNNICTNAPYASNTYNYIFRMNNPADLGRVRLMPDDFNTIGLLERIFAPDFAFKEVEWPTAAAIGATEAGFFISEEPNAARPNVYFSIPRDVYGEAASIGECIFNVADTIGILMRTEDIEEYDPSDAITNATFGTISEVTREGELFYTGQINVNLWSDVIGATDTANGRKRLWSTFGFLDSTSNYSTYAKEYLNFAAGSNQARFYYTVKAGNVSAKTPEAIKDYLINIKQLRLYYIPEEAL